MTERDFISNYTYNSIDKGEVEARCGSNIALVKYWGKYSPQIPANPSISYTLTNSFTQTLLKFKKTENFSVQVFLGEHVNEEFSQKVKKYFLAIKSYLPFIDKYEYSIHTTNSFPHSSGIASSASGFGAIADCLVQMSSVLGESNTEEYKKSKTSFLARLGSGSACRSIYKGLAVWGKHKNIPQSSDLYAVPFPYEVSPVFNSIQDTVLLIHEGQKEISSSLGHKLMENHPYSEARFTEANKNLSELSKVLQEGDLDSFGRIVEHEALTLHAMMLTSSPAFILMKPETLAVIKDIWEFRKDTGFHLYFTLDAGANVHLLYPEHEKSEINRFINSKLIKYCENNKLIMDKTYF